MWITNFTFSFSFSALSVASLPLPFSIGIYSSFVDVFLFVFFQDTLDLAFIYESSK